MAVQNLHLRGSTYWWRKKIAVLGTYVPIALSLRPGNLNRSCAIAMPLGSFVESLHMVYRERGVAIDATTLKKMFVDAMRWQLDRILNDQSGSAAPPEEHRFVNAAQGEHWRLLNRGVKWTAVRRGDRRQLAICQGAGSGTFGTPFLNFAITAASNVRW